MKRVMFGDAYIIQAGSQGGSLSKYDRLLVAIAKGKGCVCRTSDSSLKARCEKDGIRTCWGLEMMLILCRNGRLSAAEAIRVARKIHEMDSKYITAEIVDEFKRKLNATNLEI